MDKRHTYGVIVDTETANFLDDPLFYDFSYQIIDSKGRKYEERSFVNADIFIEEKEMMKSAYYAKKSKSYWNDINSGYAQLAKVSTIKRQFIKDLKDYNCRFIIAHNARFDYKSINKTLRYLTKSKDRYFTPYGLEWYDTMKLARKCIAKTPSYIKFCNENDLMTKHKTPRVRVTAEALFRFISKDTSFNEEHKGLADCDIERQIFAYCVNTKRIKMSEGILFEN